MRVFASRPRPWSVITESFRNSDIVDANGMLVLENCSPDNSRQDADRRRVLAHIVCAAVNGMDDATLRRLTTTLAKARHTLL